ncbi:hypothetical protein CAPTEDRAFT_226681 [Capitella teleta]|uniref:EF-hand domain-containing protein n=1 Tax=Capitella teleta TaxID=283909 RepID=R7U253_CAPTE|nr:hypothetical protein CAPTEDRAFT_226681 [Capitella teleta]|eukprot:ELT97741.1 hypothetical protein CAPTEDRAFT_226681 [Capitella teleta]
MKVSICFIVVALVVCIEVMTSHAANLSRSKRGFRMGAADRFSHGFGKRGGDFNSLIDGESDMVMSDEDLTEIIRADARLAQTFVKRFIDTDGDGFVSRQELFEA